MEVGLVLVTAFFVSAAWTIYVTRLGKDVRSAAQEAKSQLDSALERARAAEGVANVLHHKILRAEAALNSDADLPSAAQAARIILFTETDPVPARTSAGG